MNETERELWRALDDFVFESTNPVVRQDKLNLMRSDRAREESSLGRFLSSLRFQQGLTSKAMAELNGVDQHVWKDWEMDFGTPSETELKALVSRMRWRGYVQERLWTLWKEAPRFRLKRVCCFRGEALAARGLAVESGLAWESVGSDNQVKLMAWGQRQGFRMPEDLPEILNGLALDEDREAWVDDVLGES